MERKFETMVRWRSETIVQWIDRFEAPMTELELARDGMAAYTEDELIYDLSVEAGLCRQHLW
jgi:hypothetical protein